MANKRLERVAIATVLRQMDEPISYQDISLRGGERLASTLMEMVQDGTVTRIDAQGDRPSLYHLSPRGKASPAAPIDPNSTIQGYPS